MSLLCAFYNYQLPLDCLLGFVLTGPNANALFPISGFLIEVKVKGVYLQEMHSAKFELCLRVDR